MWKRGENEDGMGVGAVADISVPKPSSRSAGKANSGLATIGPSITVKGDVIGDEDLMIQGQVEGTVVLKKHSIVVGVEGRVRADLSARTVMVEGEVKGNLTGQEQVILRQSARVDGNISCPRVTVEDGASFRGGIDMRGATESPQSVATHPSVKSRQRSTPHEHSNAASSDEAKKVGNR
ncbi:MAG: polymer-forming cytoskeletal protein [bacterium]|nr:polymer-forming cytoskeletal protein [bacterium]